MSEPTRRSLIGAGAGAVGAAALLTGSAAAAARPTSGSAQERVVAYVSDHRSDELVLSVGDREVVVHDRDLVVRILNAAGGN